MSVSATPLCRCGRERNAGGKLCSTCLGARRKYGHRYGNESARGARHHPHRPRSEYLTRTSQADRRTLRLLNNEEPVTDRPQTRGECGSVPRPCPYVGCRHNLYLDVSRAGSVKLNFPWLEPDEMPPNMSCSLDVADEGKHTLHTIAAAMNLCRERVRQIENETLAKFHHAIQEPGE